MHPTSHVKRRVTRCTFAGCPWWSPIGLWSNNIFTVWNRCIGCVKPVYTLTRPNKGQSMWREGQFPRRRIERKRRMTASRFTWLVRCVTRRHSLLLLKNFTARATGAHFLERNQPHTFWPMFSSCTHVDQWSNSKVLCMLLGARNHTWTHQPPAVMMFLGFHRSKIILFFRDSSLRFLKRSPTREFK